MSILSVPIIAVILVALLVWRLKYERDSKSTKYVVRKMTYESIGESHKSIPLSRENLIEHFRKDFSDARHKMIVCYPDPAEKPGNYRSSHVAIGVSVGTRLDDKNIDDPFFSRMNEWFAMITGKCTKCFADASVAYFPKHSPSYERTPQIFESNPNNPPIPEITDKPVILCKACAIKEIEGSFGADNKNLDICVYTQKGEKKR